MKAQHTITMSTAKELIGDWANNHKYWVSTPMCTLDCCVGIELLVDTCGRRLVTLRKDYAWCRTYEIAKQLYDEFLPLRTQCRLNMYIMYGGGCDATKCIVCDNCTCTCSAKWGSIKLADDAAYEWMLIGSSVTCADLVKHIAKLMCLVATK